MAAPSHGFVMILRHWLALRIVAGMLIGMPAMLVFPRALVAADLAEEKVGQFISVQSPITPAEVIRVQRAAQNVLNEHLAAGNRPVLIFEIQPGPSQYHDCLKLADFIRQQLPGAEKTVAYVPQRLTGHAVMIALACQELVLHPEAAIGDIGTDESVTGDQLRLYSNLARQRRWPEALVLGMLDKELEVVEIPGNPPRFALRDELPGLKQQGVVIGAASTLKPAREPLILSASQCRNLSLAKLLARDRPSLANQYGLPIRSIKEDPTLGQEPDAVMIRIDAPIDLILSGVVTRAIDRALARGKNLIIFYIDSPGGRVDASLDIADKIVAIKGARSVAYIPKMALSGAAFAALACDEIYIASDANLGDAGPIFAPGTQFEHAPEKVVSYLAERLRTIAQSKGRPGALGEAMVDKDLIVYHVRNTQTGQETYLSDRDIQNSPNPQQWKKLRTVTKEDRFLTLSGAEAQQIELADEIVDSDNALWDRLGLSAQPETVGSTWVDKLVYFLSDGKVAVLLVGLGVLLLYVELAIPGITLAGIGSFLCFLLFFWSNILGGTAGWLEVLLFLAGIVFVALEIFVVPGFGVTGVSGILLILASLALASQTFVIVPGIYNWSGMLSSTVTVLLAMFACTVIIGVLSRYLPNIPLFNRIVLAPPDAGQVAVTPLAAGTRAELTGAARFEGKRGTTTTDLRPAGMVRFGDEFVDVVAEGAYIAQGCQVEVIEITGNRIVVKRV